MDQREDTTEWSEPRDSSTHDEQQALAEDGQPKLLKELTKSSNGNRVPIYDKTFFSSMTLTEFMGLICGPHPPKFEVSGTAEIDPKCFYDPAEVGYRRGTPVGTSFLKPKSHIHGIPTDGTTQFEIRFDKSTTKVHAQEKKATETTLRAMFTTEVFVVLESYDTTSGDPTMVEPVSIMLRGHLALNGMAYKKHHVET